MFLGPADVLPPGDPLRGQWCLFSLQVSALWTILGVSAAPPMNLFSLLLFADWWHRQIPSHNYPIRSRLCTSTRGTPAVYFLLRWDPRGERNLIRSFSSIVSHYRKEGLELGGSEWSWEGLPRAHPATQPHPQVEPLSSSTFWETRIIFRNKLSLPHGQLPCAVKYIYELSKPQMFTVPKKCFMVEVEVSRNGFLIGKRLSQSPKR